MNERRAAQLIAIVLAGVTAAIAWHLYRRTRELEELRSRQLEQQGVTP